MGITFGCLLIYVNFWSWREELKTDDSSQLFIWLTSILNVCIIFKNSNNGNEKNENKINWLQQLLAMNIK